MKCGWNYLSIPKLQVWVKLLIHSQTSSVGEITYPFPNFNGATVEVWEWIDNFAPYIIMDVITYPNWEYKVKPWE